MKILVFDVWGEYAHYKKIYATTSALSYALPPKTAVYGYIGAILGLEKEGNVYLKSFADKQCLIGLSILNPLIMKRLGINLKAELGRRKPEGSPKPTLMEFVHRPKYRLYVNHQDAALQGKLKTMLQENRSVYTPTLGLAGLLSSFEFIGEFDTEGVSSTAVIEVDSVIPRQVFEELAFSNHPDMAIIEQSMYALEMDTERNVTERDDILVERNGKPIFAKVKQYFPINGKNICLF
jgi:CRISPR-associated protein Cas5h